jgi:TRAP-type C4-dicarboxylate transport system substrate-binding protein
MITRRFVLGLAAAAAVAAAVPQARAETVLRAANWLPPTHPIVKDMLEPWAKQVAAATQGRVTVDILKAPLGKPDAHFDIAKDGIADVTFSVHGYTPGRFLLPQMAEMPFLGTSSEAMSVAYWRVYNSHLAKADEHKGVKLLSLFVHGPGHIYTSSKPIRSIEDMKGLKMRIGSSVANDISKALDMVPIQAPSSKAYELLSNGVADGIMFPHESVPFFKLEKALKYATVVPEGLYNTSFFLVMNEAKFNSLSKEDQAAVMKVSGEAFARLAGQAWDKADAAGIEAVKASGIVVETIQPTLLSDIAQRIKAVESAWAAKVKAERNIDGAAALAAFRAEIGKVK